MDRPKYTNADGPCQPSTSGRSDGQQKRKKQLIMASISVGRMIRRARAIRLVSDRILPSSQARNKPEGTPAPKTNSDKPITDVVAGALARAASQR